MTYGSQLASDTKFYLDYSKWNDELNRKETWEESVHRVMQMHRTNPKFKEAFKSERFTSLFDKTEQLYRDQFLLGSQRALQFGGDPIIQHNAKLFNCLGSYCDRLGFFQECMYLLLCGCGTGFSVQYGHITKLPNVTKRLRGAKTFVVPDSIEGWADAIGVLMSSYVEDSSKATFPDYCGYQVKFDFSLIRPKGAMINGGFKAPGSSGLRNSILKIEELLDVNINNSFKITPIIAYDIVMHIADAVLSGGVRRSATICIFSPDDKEMMNAKTRNNYNIQAGLNTQRARSNNSVCVNRKTVTKELFDEIFEAIKAFGEPGFFFVDDEDEMTNPCSEIRFWPKSLTTGESGWQGCNLATGNGSKVTSEKIFYEICEGLAMIGTLQAAYTDLKYLSKVSTEIFEQEALLGCSFTGWMSNPHIMLDPEVQKRGAQIIKDINKEIAEMIGINQSARTTCVKPEGNSSVVLQTPSGCHGDHSPLFFRNMQVNKDSEISKFFVENLPFMVEDSVWSREGTDISVAFPVTSSKNAKFKHELIGINQLEVVKLIQQNWIERGTNEELCAKPWLRHSVSNTIDLNYEDYDTVRDYLFENKDSFAAVSFLLTIGDKVYNQAPFQAVLTADQIFEKYGAASLLASGLIVDGLHAFGDNLWKACESIIDDRFIIDGTRLQVMIKRDWQRRGKQFAKRFFKGDIDLAIFCLKDLHLYHKWVTVNRELNKKKVDLNQIEFKPSYVEADTMGALSCSGGSCELPQAYLEKINDGN